MASIHVFVSQQGLPLHARYVINDALRFNVAKILASRRFGRTFLGKGRWYQSVAGAVVEMTLEPISDGM